MYKRTLRRDQIKSGHSLFVRSIDRSELPKGMKDTEGFTDFYVVKNFDDKGVVFFYLAKGNPNAPREVCGWYRNTLKFWSSYGDSIADAINKMQRDGWMYA